MDEPVVYFKPGCPFGIRLRTALTLHRVPHRSVRFRDDEDGAARVRLVNDGSEMSPTVHVADRWLTNPGWRDVRDATSTVQHHTAPDPDNVRMVADPAETARREVAEMDPRCERWLPVTDRRQSQRRPR